MLTIMLITMLSNSPALPACEDGPCRDLGEPIDDGVLETTFCCNSCGGGKNGAMYSCGDCVVKPDGWQDCHDAINHTDRYVMAICNDPVHNEDTGDMDCY